LAGPNEAARGQRAPAGGGRVLEVNVVGFAVHGADHFVHSLVAAVGKLAERLDPFVQRRPVVAVENPAHLGNVRHDNLNTSKLHQL
jgi:hypothetical protein